MQKTISHKLDKIAATSPSKYLRCLHQAAFGLYTYQIIEDLPLYNFFLKKDGSLSSIELVRQSFKLCQNASYPKMPPRFE